MVKSRVSSCPFRAHTALKSHEKYFCFKGLKECMQEDITWGKYKKIFRQLSEIEGNSSTFYYDLIDIIPEIAEDLKLGFCIVKTDSTGIIKGTAENDEIIITYDYINRFISNQII